MKNLIRSFLLFTLPLFLFNACVTLVPPSSKTPSPSSSGSGNSTYVKNFPENFENASKGTYAAGSVSLLSGEWYFQEGMIGSTENDTKAGNKAIRLRDGGIFRMNFSLSGVKDIRIAHGAYGTDGNSEWELWASVNNGSSWKQIGNRVKTNGNRLTTMTFAVNVSSSIRFEIRKIGADGYRLNLDDIALTPYSGTGGTSAIVVATRDEPLAFGNPSQASKADENNYLIVKNTYTLSYNRKKGTANWVSWHLNEAWKGPAQRTNNFRLDTQLSSTWFRAEPSDYTNTGFDRGHLCPSDDRDASEDENDETFLMTNIVPQAPNNNRGPWKDLEEFCRQVALRGYDLYITAGVYGSGGIGSNGGTTKYLADGKITVPAFVWKVIVINPLGSADKRRITEKSRVIAIKMPNKQWVGDEPWGDFRVSVDDLENLLGYEFLSNASVTMQQNFEKSVDTGSTNPKDF